MFHWAAQPAQTGHSLCNPPLQCSFFEAAIRALCSIFIRQPAMESDGLASLRRPKGANDKSMGLC